MNVVVVDNRSPLHSQHPVAQQKHSMTTQLIETLSRTPQVQLNVVKTVEGICKINFDRVDMLFLSGSAMRVTYPHDVPASRTAIVATTWALANNVAIVGVCYGAQLVTWMMGGTVSSKPGDTKPYQHNTTFGCMYFNHTDAITKAPPGFKILSQHPRWGYILTLVNSKKQVVLTQWHPEGTEDGQRFLSNLLATQLNKKFLDNKHVSETAPGQGKAREQ